MIIIYYSSIDPCSQLVSSMGGYEIRYMFAIAARIAHTSPHPFCACVIIVDHIEPLFLIIQKPVNLRPERLKIVRPEQRTTRRHALEVVDRAPVRPGHRQAANPLLIDNAAHQSHTAGRHAPQYGK